MKSIKQTRLLMIDGLRGIAALLVVFNHLYGNIKTSIESWFPHAIGKLFEHGYVGVHIFFVVSGFVIAYSVGDARFSPGFLGRFALRRSIRLDPPYWTSIGFAVLLTYLSTVLFSDIHRELPSAEQITAHIFYIQNLLGYGDIVAVYWTLCLEIQFYLVFICLIGIFQYLQKTHSTSKALQARSVRWALFTLGIFSIINYLGLFSINMKYTFLPYWHNFMLGVFACWTIRGWLKKRYLLIFSLVIFCLSIVTINKHQANIFTAIITAIGIYLAGISNKILSIFSSAPYQYLGKLSYSLYLFHPIIGWSIISIGKHYLGPDLGVLEGSAVFLSGILVSILSANLIYLLVEQPSLSLSHKITLLKQADYLKDPNRVNAA